MKAEIMKLSLAVACALLLALGRATPEEAPEDAEDGPSCVADAAGDAELSVLSGENATGHWLAKVRLLHAAGAAGAAAEGASLRPVQLQLQRSAQTRRGGGRTVALEATLAGSPTARPGAAESGVLDSGCKAFPQRQTSGCPVCPSPCPLPCPACPACPSPPACPSACPSPPACPSACPAPTPPPRRIPPGYVLKEGLGYYKYHTVPVSWFEAKATCEREGAHLVILNSKSEAQMVVNFFKELGLPDSHWGIRVGLHDLLREGSFFTVLGQPITDTGYAEWGPGQEPSNSRGEEHCVTLHESTKLNDIPCSWNGTFVCELP